MTIIGTVIGLAFVWISGAMGSVAYSVWPDSGLKERLVLGLLVVGPSIVGGFLVFK